MKLSSDFDYCDDEAEEFIVAKHREHELYKAKLANRFQNQPWYIRLWRRRHLIPVPYYAVKTWWKHRKNTKDDPFYTPWRLAWGMEVGSAHMKMCFWYTAEETSEYLRGERE